MPIFSVVIPTYNRAKFISSAINSVLAQSFADFELIVVNDGSTDNTVEVVSTFNDPRIRYLEKKNGERGAARNYGSQNAKGNYITFLDSDDIFCPNHLESAEEFLKQFPNCPIFCQGYEIKENGKTIFRSKFKEKVINHHLLKGNPLSCIGIFLREDTARNYQFNENRTLAGSEDWELWIRIASQIDIQYNPVITACMTAHDERSVVNFSANKLIDRIQLALNLVLNNPEFLAKYGIFKNKVQAHLYFYLALHLAMGGSKKLAIKYWQEAVLKTPSLVFTRKSLGIIKNLLLAR